MFSLRKNPSPLNPSTKTIFKCLVSQREWLRLLVNSKKSYLPLLDYLLREPIDLDYIDRIRLKHVASQLGTNPGTLSTWCKKIYDELWNLNYDTPDLFKTDGRKYNLYATDYEGRTEIFTMWINTAFALHETIVWEFVAGRLRDSTFFISNVKHDINNSGDITTLTLKSGKFNCYRQSLIDKGKFLNLITWDELNSLSERELDILLYCRVELGKKDYNLPENDPFIRL